MELLEGETLRARLQRSALGWRKAAGIGVAIAEGLAAAHAKGIIAPRPETGEHLSDERWAGEDSRFRHRPNEAVGYGRLGNAGRQRETTSAGHDHWHIGVYVAGAVARR